jgi:hypothetical protein
LRLDLEGGIPVHQSDARDGGIDDERAVHAALDGRDEGLAAGDVAPVAWSIEDARLPAVSDALGDGEGEVGTPLRSQKNLPASIEDVRVHVRSGLHLEQVDL